MEYIIARLHGKEAERRGHSWRGRKVIYIVERSGTNWLEGGRIRQFKSFKLRGELVDGWIFHECRWGRSGKGASAVWLVYGIR